jgi:glycosyltransferase involved in cell wall biosynthesis
MPTVCFIATNQGVPWGASEYLWAGAAYAIAARTDVEVAVCVKGWSAGVPAIRQLGASGSAIFHRPVDEDEDAFMKCEVPSGAARWVARLRPDLVVVSHGDNREGLPWMEFCAERNIRYVTVAHRASEWDWPDSRLMPRLRAAYLSACASHFVSRHNWRLTERMICVRLPHAAVVRNPFNVSYTHLPPWPPASDGMLRMACVARLDLESKAHDVLFDVLATSKWRGRALAVEIVGREGPHAGLLRELSSFLQLERVTFHDSVEQISSVWEQCHALILPSRKEGLPVAVVEAMLAGRPCLVTDIGGSAELVEHARSGWVAESPTGPALDRALDLAWDSRRQWSAMGSYAARAIRSLVPADPAGTYGELLLELLPEPQRDDVG